MINFTYTQEKFKLKWATSFPCEIGKDQKTL